MTTKTTPTGVRLRAVDGGKAPRVARDATPERGEQTTLWDLVRRAQEREREEKLKPPADEPSKPGG